MGESSDEKKKKTTFRKIEDGMIYQTEDGETIAYGLPSEIETRTVGEGKGGLGIKGVVGEVAGERYKRVAMDWHFVGRPLTPEEVTDYSDAVTDISGTISCNVHTSVPYQSFNFCPKCGHSTSTSAKYCNQCGQEL